MPYANTLTLAQLQRAVVIKQQIEALEAELNSVIGLSSRRGRPKKSAWGMGKQVVAEKPAKKRKMSAAGRAAISKAAKERWAKIKAEKKQ